MSIRVPPAHPRQDHQRIERIAYLKLLRGEITIEQYRQAIALPCTPHGARKRRWWRVRD